VKVVATEKVRHLRYERLRRSLQDSILIWPHNYCHKVIGRNDPAFLSGIVEFERSFPSLHREGSQLSKNGTYLSLTYRYAAKDVDEIISLWIASEQVKDVVTVM